jgi:hypothetical protein
MRYFGIIAPLYRRMVENPIVDEQVHFMHQQPNITSHINQLTETPTDAHTFDDPSRRHLEILIRLRR